MKSDFVDFVVGLLLVVIGFIEMIGGSYPFTLAWFGLGLVFMCFCAAILGHWSGQRARIQP